MGKEKSGQALLHIEIVVRQVHGFFELAISITNHWKKTALRKHMLTKWLSYIHGEGNSSSFTVRMDPRASLVKLDYRKAITLRYISNLCSFFELLNKHRSRKGNILSIKPTNYLQLMSWEKVLVINALVRLKPIFYHLVIVILPALHMMSPVYETGKVTVTYLSWTTTYLVYVPSKKHSFLCRRCKCFLSCASRTSYDRYLLLCKYTCRTCMTQTNIIWISKF